MPQKQSITASKWDEKHNVKPVSISMTQDEADLFTYSCEEFHFAEKDVLNLLIKYFVDGKINCEFPKKKVKGIKIDKDLYQQLGEKCKEIAKEQGLNRAPTKSSVINRLIQLYIKHPQDVIDNIPELKKFTDSALVANIKAFKEKTGKIPSNKDMENPRAYTRVFGSWYAALYVSGMIDYKDYCSLRPTVKTKWSTSELVYVLYKRIEDTNDNVDPQKNFPYPDQEAYEKYAWGYMIAYAKAKQTKL